MNQALFDLLACCAARIVVGSRMGTGSFVGPGLLLTCAHVVESARSSSVPIDVYWRGQRYEAVIVSYFANPWPDLALLSVQIEEHACVYLHASCLPYDSLYCYGFTPEYPDGESATVQCEGWAGAKQLLLKLKAGQIRPGLSGAPLVNLRTGGVCGIVKSSRDRNSDLGGRAVPTTVILDQMQEVVNQQQKIHLIDTRWVECIGSETAAVAAESSINTAFNEFRVFLNVESSNSWEGKIAEEMCVRANALHTRTYLLSATLDVILHGDTKRLTKALADPHAVVITIVENRLSEKDMEELLRNLQRQESRERAQMILMFNHSPKDIFEIDSDQLARIKCLREAAQNSGAVHFEYSTEREFRQTIWYWLCRMFDLLTSASREAPRADRSKVLSVDRSKPYYFHSVPAPKHYVVRDDAESLIGDEFGEGAAGPVVVVTGVGGTGKTTLCARSVHQSFERIQSYRGLFWFSLNGVATEGVSTFFTSLLEYLGRDDLREPWRREPYVVKSSLLRHLNDIPYIIAIDGLESMQIQNSNSPKFGEVKDRLLRDFIVGACSLRRSRVLINSRIAPTDIINSSGCTSLTVPQFTRDQALAFLNEHKLKGPQEDLEAVANHFAYHPLSLTMAAVYIGRFYGGNASRFIQEFIRGTEHPLSEKLARVLEDYWSQLARHQQLFLTLIAALDGALTGAGIDLLARNLTRQQNPVAASSIRSELVTLADTGFVMTSVGKDGDVEYSIHPVIKALITNTLSTSRGKKEAAMLWAFIEGQTADALRDDSAAELDARAREVHFLLDAGEIEQALNQFTKERLNARLFQAGRHDLGIPLGERVYALVGSQSFIRPQADYLSGYLPDHFACAGRIRSAVNIMKTIPMDDHWTAMCDQIWILLRGGEHRFAREVIARAPEWRQRGDHDWVMAQLCHYEGDKSCLAHFEAALSDSLNLLASYKVRLRTQFANALIDFGSIEKAAAVVADIPPLRANVVNPFPSEQIHTELARARIALLMEETDKASAMADTALVVGRAVGDDYGMLCSLLSHILIQLNISPSFDNATSSSGIDVSQGLKDIQQILRVTSEGETTYGFPIEAIKFHLILAYRSTTSNDALSKAYHLDSAQDLSRFCEHHWSAIRIENLRRLLSNGDGSSMTS